MIFNLMFMSIAHVDKTNLQCLPFLTSNTSCS